MFDRFGAWAPAILSILRFLAGVMFACHGAQKLFGAFGGMPPGMEIPWYIYYIAGPIELVGGILIAIGLLTRPVAFLSSGLMAAAYFKGHAFGTGSFVFWPKVNGGEIAVLYCWLFLYIAAAGPGAWAVDNLFRRKRSGAPASSPAGVAASRAATLEPRALAAQIREKLANGHHSDSAGLIAEDRAR